MIVKFGYTSQRKEGDGMIGEVEELGEEEEKIGEAAQEGIMCEGCSPPPRPT